MGKYLDEIQKIWNDAMSGDNGVKNRLEKFRLTLDKKKNDNRQNRTTQTAS